MDKSHVIFILSVLGVATLLLAWLARSMRAHTARLRERGETANATVVKILGNGKQASAYYEFITLTDSLGKGIHRIIPEQKSYAVGDEVEVTYLPDRPSISSITSHLDDKIALLKRVSTTIGFTALASAVLLALLLFLTNKYNII